MSFKLSSRLGERLNAKRMIASADDCSREISQPYRSENNTSTRYANDRRDTRRETSQVGARQREPSSPARERREKRRGSGEASQRNAIRMFIAFLWPGDIDRPFVTR